MPIDILCLRPESDFTRVGVAIPPGPSIAFRAPDAADVPELMKEARVLVIPAVGPKLAPALFEPATALKLVQITGAGVERSAPRMPPIARIAPMLTTGLDGASRTTSAPVIASTTPGPAEADSAPTKAKLWVSIFAR